MITVRVCPECGEKAVARAPRTPMPAGQPVVSWSHHNGQPLCPVVGLSGYQPADPVVPAEIGPALAGCWIEGHTVRTDDELSAAVIELAVDLGMETTEDDRAVLDAWATVRPGAGDTRHGDDDLSGELWDYACDALDYLNGRTVDGSHFEINDGLILLDAADDDLDDWFPAVG